MFVSAAVIKSLRAWRTDITCKKSGTCYWPHWPLVNTKNVCTRHGMCFRDLNIFGQCQRLLGHTFSACLTSLHWTSLFCWTIWKAKSLLRKCLWNQLGGKSADSNCEFMGVGEGAAAVIKINPMRLLKSYHQRNLAADFCSIALLPSRWSQQYHLSLKNKLCFVWSSNGEVWKSQTKGTFSRKANCRLLANRNQTRGHTGEP